MQALGLAFTTSTVCLAVFLHQNPVDSMPLDYRMSLIALLPALIGMWAGKKLRCRIPEQKFRTVFFAGLIVFGLYMMLHSLGWV